MGHGEIGFFWCQGKAAIAAEKAAALKKRKILWESLREQTESGNLVSTLTGRGHTGFAASTAEVTGMSKQAINEYIRIADQLGFFKTAVLNSCRFLIKFAQNNVQNLNIFTRF